MKKEHILLVTAFSTELGVSLFSCSDYLSVERLFNGRQSEEKISKSKQFTGERLAKCYGLLNGSNMEYGPIKFTFPNYSDNIIFNESDGAVNYNALKFGQYDNGWVNNSYICCYGGVRQASIMINNVDINEELTKEEILDRKAQVRFLGAYFYWLLLRRYDPVPLIPDETISTDETYTGMPCPRATYDEVVGYIDKEMIFAANDLSGR